MGKITFESSSENTEECKVCYEEYDPSKIVECYCGNRVCEACCKMYILSKTSAKGCMSCGGEWPYTFIYKNFGNWAESNAKGGYRTHYKAMLLEREKARIPETITLMKVKEAQLERDKEIAKLTKPFIMRKRRYEASYKKYTQMLRNMKPTQFKSKDELKEMNRLTKKIEHLNIKLGEIDLILEDMSEEGYDGVERHISIICACPFVNENKQCKGLITDDGYTCPVCSTVVCKECREIISCNTTKDDDTQNEEHECNPDTVKTIKSMVSDTRPCPKCAAPIFKIDGCDQMWCTKCHTAFSWNTGEIQKGIIHNPHALEWRRQNGGLDRDPGDTRCGGLRQSNVYTKAFRGNTLYINALETIFARTAEIGPRDLDQYNFDLQKYRIEYIKGNIEEKAYIAKIFTTERAMERDREENLIVLTFRDLLIDAFRELEEDLKPFVEHVPSKAQVVMFRFNEYNGIIRRGMQEIYNISPKDQRIIFTKFFDKCNNIRKFINETMYKEMKILGKKYPKKMLEQWEWGDERTQEKRMKVVNYLKAHS